MARSIFSQLSCLFWALLTGRQIQKKEGLAGGSGAWYKNINFYKFSGRSQQEEKCGVVQYPGNHLEQAESGSMHNQLTEMTSKRMKKRWSTGSWWYVGKRAGGGEPGQGIEVSSSTCSMKKQGSKQNPVSRKRIIKNCENHPGDSKGDEVECKQCRSGCFLKKKDQTGGKIKIIYHFYAGKFAGKKSLSVRITHRERHT